MGSNLRIGYEAYPGDWVIGFVFSATERRKPGRYCGRNPALFDKSIEERETQAAESWRIHATRASVGRIANRLWRYCVSAITIVDQIRGNPDRVR